MVSRRVRRRRTEFAVGGAAFLLLIIYLAAFSGGSGKPPATTTSTTSHSARAAISYAHFPKKSPLNPGWTGDGQSVTLGFGGDVHFEGTVGQKLAADPSTALGTTIPQLFAGTNVTMVNLESVVTDGTCPEPQNKQYIFDAPASAVTALKSAKISLVTEANDHGYDCGAEGLSQNLTIATQDAYPIIGVGDNAAKAFTPFRVTVNGQRIAIIAATQVIDSNLVSTWTATGTQPGVASAIDPTELVSEVQQVRKTADTVIVYLHWGTETQSCPNSQQEPLAQQLVKAGADIVIGSNSHVLSGAGYLGSAYVSYGLGNFAFYDTNPPETNSGALDRDGRGPSHHECRLPSGHDRLRAAPTADRSGGDDRRPELELGTHLHQPRRDPVEEHGHAERRDQDLRRAADHHDHHLGHRLLRYVGQHRQHHYDDFLARRDDHDPAPHHDDHKARVAHHHFTHRQRRRIGPSAEHSAQLSTPSRTSGPRPRAAPGRPAP